ncbi:MAG: dihydrofolate reductase [Bacteroidetes bacterium]|nr:MAG: dihydrofolate reductase [Bacteroidota bacterium]
MKYFLILLSISFLLTSPACKQKAEHNETTSSDSDFNYIADRFSDIQVLRYKVPGFEDLSVDEKELAYYLYEAGLCGRDIFYDQKYRHGLLIRKTLEAILNSYTGDKHVPEWKLFEEYCNRVFFANGIHHHYSGAKMLPAFNQEYFANLVLNSDPSQLPLNGLSIANFKQKLSPIIFDPTVDPKNVDLSDGKDVILASSNNFYRDVTQKEAEDYYNELKAKNPDDKSQIGLNSQLVKMDGKISERVWKIDGMYGPAITKIVYWLEKAQGVAKNEAQRNTIGKLINFYRSGKPKDFDEYNIAWVKDTSARIDFVNGFIEVYQDALQKKGCFESIVSLKDLEATKRIKTISKEAQWFEDNSTLMEEHKKKNVIGITAKVITVIGEVGDAAPATPIGINLPNSEWIGEDYGSKSVSLGNIVEAYNYYRAKSPMIEEFGASQEVKDRSKKYYALSDELHTDMHEVIGHASGIINKGVGTTDQTLKNYAGVLEEGRADLVALYYCLDQKLVDIGVMPSLETGKAQYDYYIMNGMMTQLQRINPGDNLEQAHMRNRQMVASWAFEKGAKDNVIEKVVREGKTYFVINDYTKLRALFGELLRETQRIKSEGDFEAGKNLVETYGVKVDQNLLQEVHKRYENLKIAPYMGFIQPRLVPIMKENKIVDVKIEYPSSLIEQMLEYGKKYSYLPVEN